MSIFVPAAGLVKQIGPDGLVLCLGTEDWFKLQAHIQGVMALPYDFAEYQTRYGDASSGLPMQKAFDATKKLRQIAVRYGSPSSLRMEVSKNPGILASPTRPSKDTYLATTWTLQRAHEDALRISQALANLPETAKGQPPAEVVAGIKSLFLDTDQILDRVRQTEAALSSLLEELQSIERQLAAAEEELREYTSSSSQTMAFLNEEIGGIQNTIKKLEQDRDVAWRKWLDLTIASVAVPAVIAIVGVAIMVALAVPTGGGSFAIGGAVTTAAATAAGAGLGVAATNARSDYEGLVQEYDSKSNLLQKRIAYRHDLGALDQQMKFGLPASTGVIDQVALLRNAWKSLGSEIQFKVADLSAETLKSGPWLREAEMKTAADNWSRVNKAIQAFSINSLVDSAQLAFGAALPADDSQWKQKFLKTIAA